MKFSRPKDGVRTCEVELTLSVTYDETKTDAEAVASALDTLLETAMSTPNIFEEYGNLVVGDFHVQSLSTTRPGTR